MSLDRPVIDLCWRVSHGVLYTAERLVGAFTVRYLLFGTTCSALRWDRRSRAVSFSVTAVQLNAGAVVFVLFCSSCLVCLCASGSIPEFSARAGALRYLS